MFFTSELGKGFIISDEEEVRPLFRGHSYIANKGLGGKGANKTPSVIMQHILILQLCNSLCNGRGGFTQSYLTLFCHTQVTGVISMKDPTKKKKKKRKKAGREGSLRARISETISDTLRRAGRRKKTSVRCDIPNFLFVNKPHFSSDESLADQR